MALRWTNKNAGLVSFIGQKRALWQFTVIDFLRH